MARSACPRTPGPTPPRLNLPLQGSSDGASQSGGGRCDVVWLGSGSAGEVPSDPSKGLSLSQERHCGPAFAPPRRVTGPNGGLPHRLTSRGPGGLPLGVVRRDRSPRDCAGATEFPRGSAQAISHPAAHDFSAIANMASSSENVSEWVCLRLGDSVPSARTRGIPEGAEDRFVWRSVSVFVRSVGAGRRSEGRECHRGLPDSRPG